MCRLTSAANHGCPSRKGDSSHSLLRIASTSKARSCNWVSAACNCAPSDVVTSMARLTSSLTLSKLCRHNLTRMESHPPQVNERGHEAAVNAAIRTSSAFALRTTLAPHLTFQLPL
jgi:hypothetical protein